MSASNEVIFNSPTEPNTNGLPPSNPPPVKKTPSSELATKVLNGQNSPSAAAAQPTSTKAIEKASESESLVDTLKKIARVVIKLTKDPTKVLCYNADASFPLELADTQPEAEKTSAYPAAVKYLFQKIEDATDTDISTVERKKKTISLMTVLEDFETSAYGKAILATSQVASGKFNDKKTLIKGVDEKKEYFKKKDAEFEKNLTSMIVKINKGLDGKKGFFVEGDTEEKVLPYIFAICDEALKKDIYIWPRIDRASASLVATAVKGAVDVDQVAPSALDDVLATFAESKLGKKLLAANEAHRNRFAALKTDFSLMHTVTPEKIALSDRACSMNSQIRPQDLPVIKLIQTMTVRCSQAFKEERGIVSPEALLYGFTYALSVKELLGLMNVALENLEAVKDMDRAADSKSSNRKRSTSTDKDNRKQSSSIDKEFGIKDPNESIAYNQQRVIFEFCRDLVSCGAYQSYLKDPEIKDLLEKVVTFGIKIAHDPVFKEKCNVLKKRIDTATAKTEALTSPRKADLSQCLSTITKVMDGSIASKDYSSFVAQLATDFKVTAVKLLDKVELEHFSKNVRSKKPEVDVPDLSILLDWNDRISQFVLERLLSSKTVEEAKAVYELFIDIASESVEQKDLFTAYAINAVFSMHLASPITKLIISKPADKKRQILDDLFSPMGNDKQVRQKITDFKGECLIPLALVTKGFVNLKESGGSPWEASTMNTVHKVLREFVLSKQWLHRQKTVLKKTTDLQDVVFKTSTEKEAKLSGSYEQLELASASLFKICTPSPKKK